MKLQKITEKEFVQLAGCEKIICSETTVAHQFALIWSDNLENNLALCWRSEFIEPSVLTKNNILWLGIDQQLLAIKENPFQIALNICLHTNFLEILETDGNIIIRTELEIYIFNAEAKIQSFTYLPEISDSVEIISSKLKVNLIDGNNLTLNL